MKTLNLLKIFNEKFSARLFIKFTIFIIIISSSFTVFFIQYQNRSLTDTLIKKGELLARILAYNSRLGLFSENKEMLKDPVLGILRQDEVMGVSIFTVEGKLLRKDVKSGINSPKRLDKGDVKRQDKLFEKLKESESPLYLESSDKFEFWAQVISSSSYITEESLFFENSSNQSKSQIIGYVGITFDKRILDKMRKGLLFKSILLVLIFLILGSVVTYFIAKKITKPLNRLTESVKTLGIEGDFKKVYVETDDEIGRLAVAFNHMAKSLRKREDEKQKLTEQLQHAQKMEAIGTLSGGVAHDFNNILTAIIGYGNLIQLKMDMDNPLRQYVDQILSSSSRAADLIRNLLAFSRKQMINPKPLNLNDNIKNVEKILMRLIGEDIELKVNLTNKDFIIMADSGQIDQVLMNLVTNARDAMPDGGALTITTEFVELGEEFINGYEHKKPGQYVLMSIADTGFGIDEKTREKIFDPFFTTKEVGKGTGLGLSIVYGIITQHDGYIDVFSKPGKGTEFKIYLPLIDLTAEESESESLHFSEGGTETVLIAEDDEDVRIYIKDILEKFGYSVISAENGEDAVSKFNNNKEKIQILLFDVIMPKMNGKAAFEEIRKVKPNIKVIFMSGYAGEVLQEKGKIDNEVNVIFKPITAEELLKQMRDFLDKR